MGALNEAQRAGIVERLEHNRKCSALVLYTAHTDQQKASEFASVLREAGWTVSESEITEAIPSEGLHIGVPDLDCTCPGARLLLDVFVSVGLDARFVKAPYILASSSPNNCCLLIGHSVETSTRRRSS